MGPTHKGSSSQSEGQRSLFENAARMPSGQDKTERGLSADPNVPLQAEPILRSRVPEAENPQPIFIPRSEPVWAQRLKLVIFVLFCVELGMLLVVLPWTPVWTQNSLLAAHPELRAAFQHYFTRGAVTGLGLVDMWIGIWAAVQYREKK